jgi:hypothetical protein
MRAKDRLAPRRPDPHRWPWTTTPSKPEHRTTGERHAIRSSIGCALIIRLIIQTILLDPSGAIWTDEAPNLSRLDPSSPPGRGREDTDGTALGVGLLNQQSGPSVITTAITLRLGVSREAMSAPASSAAAPTAHQATAAAISPRHRHGHGLSALSPSPSSLTPMTRHSPDRRTALWWPIQSLRPPSSSADRLPIAK